MTKKVMVYYYVKKDYKINANNIKEKIYQIK